MSGATASFQVAAPLHAVLELGSDGYELASFSSGLISPRRQSHLDAPCYILYGESVMIYIRGRLNDFNVYA
jgi:hypothetical protein